MHDRSFGVLGRMEVHHHDVVCKLPPGRQQAVLATLLIHADEVVSASFLLDRVWGERADRSVLNVCMMRLRRSLHDPHHDVLRGEGDGYRLAVGTDDVDLHRFRKLCREAASVAERGDEGRERDLLHEALALWRGEPFHGVDSPAIQSELVPILIEERLTATERRIDADLRLGLDRDLIAELRELVGSHPFREQFWHQLMMALVRSGRTSDALDAYRSARDVFTAELGIEPSVELRQLQQRILNDDATLLRPVPSEQTDLPTRAYVPLVPAQLPPLAAGFSGRTRERQELRELSDAPGDGLRVVSITGTPGVGKTTLALRWAADVGEKFPDGQLYVDLRGHASRSPMEPFEALVGFLRALGVDADDIPADQEAASALYRTVTAGRRLLILLDNAADTNRVRPLLPGGDGCLVIVTSREQLTGLVALDGAHELVVGTLDDDEARALVRKILGRERFDAEPAAIDELVRVCARLPLALRVAGANIARRQELSVADHVAGLQAGVLDALAVEGDVQLAVRSVFASSYANLSVRARSAFRMLGLFPGRELDVPAVAVLLGCSIDDASTSLERLRGAHLVQPRPRGRFVVHDLLRIYADEIADRELSEESRAAAVRRLYVYYAHAVDEAAQRLFPQAARLSVPTERPHLEVSFADADQAVRWLEDERANIVAAVTATDTMGEHLNACRIASALRGYLLMQADWVSYLAVGRASLSAARTIADPKAEAAARLSLANLHQRRLEFAAAGAHYKRALALSRHAGWTHGEAAAHNNLAICLGDQGFPRPAVEHLRRAYELNKRSGWLAGQAMNLNNLGGIEMEMGRTTEALADLCKAHQLHKRLDSRQGEAHSLSALGEVYMARGDHVRAKKLLNEALTMQEALDDRMQISFTLAYLANVHLQLREYECAVELASRAVERGGKESPDAAAAALHVLGGVDHAHRRYDRAIETYQRAIGMARTSRRPTPTHVGVLIDSGRAYADLGRGDVARQLIDRAAAMARRAGFDAHVTAADVVRAELAAQARKRASG